MVFSGYRPSGGIVGSYGSFIPSFLRNLYLVKNLPAMWKTWLRSLGWEDPLEKGKATHSSILA